MSKKHSKNISTVLEILRDEVRGDVFAALKKMSKGYSMTWVYQKGKKLFPSVKVDVTKKMEEVYPIKGRRYEIKNVAEGDSVVMVELIESYPDPKTEKVYRTPLVLVLEMDKGKIKTGRHYCDPKLSDLYLSRAKLSRVFKGGRRKSLVIK